VEPEPDPDDDIEMLVADVERELRAMGVALPQVYASFAFKLHDTYGFPIDLTRIMAEERGMTVDLAGYEKLMEEAREKARAGGKESDTRLLELPPQALAQLQGRGVSRTDDKLKYTDDLVKGRLIGIWDGEALRESLPAPEGQRLALILDRTCMYSEMGGQVGDSGNISVASHGVLRVETTRQAGSYVLHVGRVPVASDFKVGAEATVTLSPARVSTEQNHTTTHLANWALREVLGEGVQQKGSLVDPEKLRFDFSHNKALADDEIGRVEQLVNESIGRKLKVYAEEAPQEQALKINGLRAVFGEKYPPLVRVVSVGVPVADLLSDPANEKWRQYSVEFCGGTHLTSADEAESFVVTAEESVSKGIRRIVAHTGTAAKEVQTANAAMEKLIDQAHKTPEAQLATVVQEVQKSLASSSLGLRMKRRAQAAVAELQSKLKAWEKTQKQSGASAVDVSGIAEQLMASATPIGPGKLIIGEVPGAGGDQLLAVFDSLKKRSGSYGILLGGAAEGKVNFIAAVSDDVIKLGLKAGDWIREAAKVAGGGGGGRPQMAQAGGKDPAKLAEALATGRAFAAKFGG
jgi:alanyl-tRNA synthetase